MQFCPSGIDPNDLVIPECTSEFGTLKTAVVSSISDPFIMDRAYSVPAGTTEKIFDVQIHPIPEETVEHYKFTKALRAHGVRLLYPHYPSVSPSSDERMANSKTDGYLRDWIGVVDQQIYFTNVSAFRRQYRTYIKNALRYTKKDSLLETDECFTWGNAIVDEDAVLIGSFDMNDLYHQIQANGAGANTTALIQEIDDSEHGTRLITRSIQEKTNRSVKSVLLSEYTDLDFAIAPLPRLRRGGKRRVLVQLERMHPAGVETLKTLFDEVIPVQDPPKLIGANIQWLSPETAIITSEACKTAEQLTYFGYDVLSLPMKAIHATADNTSFAPGGWRCSIAPVVRSNDYFI